MLTLIPETGAGLADANSFCSVDDADAYHEARLHCGTWVSAGERKAAALVWATRLMVQHLRWRGYPTSTTQALPLPAAGLVSVRTGLPIASNVVPTQVREATAEFARLLIESDRPMKVGEPDVLSQSNSNESTSVTFRQGPGSMPTVPFAVLIMLTDVLDTTVSVVRA